MKSGSCKKPNELQTQAIRLIKKSTQGPGRFFVFILSFMMVLAAHNAIFGEKNVTNNNVKQIINKAYNFQYLVDLPIVETVQENSSGNFIDDLVISSYENQWWEMQISSNQSNEETEELGINTEIKRLQLNENIFQAFASQ